MSGNTKAKATKAAEGIVPLGLPNRGLLVAYCVQGYMAGHAAHTRWMNKKLDNDPEWQAYLKQRYAPSGGG
jgi:hypothetical protein